MKPTLFAVCASLAFGCTAGNTGRTNPNPDGGGMTPADGAAPPDGAAPADLAKVDGTMASSALVDPNCVDGRYSETLPNVGVSLDDVVFNAADVTGFYLTVLDRRYPIGAAIVRGGKMNTGRGDCVKLFADNPTTAADAYANLDTVVHECGHFYDSLLSGSGSTNVYYLRDTVKPSCMRGDTTKRGGDTFERSRLRSDSYYSQRPACPRLTVGPACDFYAELYLEGDPDDNTFQSGDQGYNYLLEEFVQYINSLATSWTFLDQMSPGLQTTARDGMLTFLWYVERYLRMARLQYPAAYARIANDQCWREATLNAWGRAWIYLEQTEGETALGFYDSTIYKLVIDPDLLAEIGRLRQLAGCP